MLLALILLGGFVLLAVFVHADIVEEGRAQLRCLGCTKGRIVPGCEVHDPQLRKPGAVTPEDTQTTRRAEPSLYGR